MISEEEGYNVYVEACREIGVGPRSFYEWKNGVDSTPSKRTRLKSRIPSLDLETQDQIAGALGVVFIGLLVLYLIFVNGFTGSDHKNNWDGLIGFLTIYASMYFLGSSLERMSDPREKPRDLDGKMGRFLEIMLYAFIPAVIWFGASTGESIDHENREVKEVLEAQMSESSCLFLDWDFSGRDTKGEAALQSELTFFDERPDGFYRLAVTQDPEPRLRPDLPKAPEGDILESYSTRVDGESISLVDLVETVCN